MAVERFHVMMDGVVTEPKLGGDLLFAVARPADAPASAAGGRECQGIAEASSKSGS